MEIFGQVARFAGQDHPANIIRVWIRQHAPEVRRPVGRCDGDIPGIALGHDGVELAGHLTQQFRADPLAQVVEHATAMELDLRLEQMHGQPCQGQFFVWAFPAQERHHVGIGLADNGKVTSYRCINRSMGRSLTTEPSTKLTRGM